MLCFAFDFFFLSFLFLHFCSLTKNDAWHVFPINSGLSFPASHFWRLWDLKSAPCLPQNWSLAPPCSLGRYRGIPFLFIPVPAQAFPGLDVEERQMGTDPFPHDPCPAIPSFGCGGKAWSSSAPRRSHNQRCDVNVCLHLNSSPPLLVAGK